MEVLGAIASVAGILGFTGQALDGSLKLRVFFAECAKASRSIARFLNELNSLIQTLEDVKDILRSLEKDVAKDDLAGSILVSLQIQLDDCSKEVYDWVNKASALHPETSSGTKQSFKKFLVAVKKPDRDEICGVISKHRQNITTKLSVIGR
jgi:hypothetical protein